MSPLWLLVGLGNPGKAYAQTRHNIGFAVLDGWAAQQNTVTWRADKKLQGHIMPLRQSSPPQILLKPQTFMNLSGKAVLATMQYYQLELSRVLVVYDDVDLPFGSIRIKQSGGPGTHNGMKSLVTCLGSQQFPRIRVGVGQPVAQRREKDLADFVLASFSPEEQLGLDSLIQTTHQAIQMYLQQSPQAAMNLYNQAKEMTS